MMDRNARLVLNNAIIFVVALTILIVVVLLGLKKYTHHSELIVVPDVTTLTVEDASVFFKKKGLRYKVIDSLHIKSRLPGTILEQKPLPGSRVKYDRFIFLTINALTEDKVILPDLRDFSQRQAVATIEAIGLRVANIEYIPSEFRNLVLDIRYNERKLIAGSDLPRGSYVTLVVGQGDASGEILAPSLHGLSLNEAVDATHTKSLNLGDIHYDVTPANTEDAKLYKVYRQDPISGSPIAMGKKIELWMTTNTTLIDSPEETFLGGESQEVAE